MHPLVARALDKPGAILIRWDSGNFQDESEIAYEIGIQQPRQHARFANFFCHGGEWWMYFKHDSEIPPGEPSEIGGRYWAKVRLAGDEESLLDRSYDLVLAKQSRAGRAAVNAPNTFRQFHEIALSLRERVYVRYSDAPETPEISLGGRAIGRFSWNSLYLNGAELAANRQGEWRRLLVAAIDEGS